MIDAANQFNLGGAIPSPHVTALYGIDTIEDEDVMIPVPLSDRFQLDTLDENEDEDEH